MAPSSGSPDAQLGLGLRHVSQQPELAIPLGLEALDGRGGHEVAVAVLAVGKLAVLISLVTCGRETPRKSAASVVGEHRVVPGRETMHELVQGLERAGGQVDRVGSTHGHGRAAIAGVPHGGLELIVERGEAFCA